MRKKHKLLLKNDNFSGVILHKWLDALTHRRTDGQRDRILCPSEAYTCRILNRYRLLRLYILKSLNMFYAPDPQ